MTEVRTKRVYEPPDPADGYRVLVDRLWPRGESRERAALDEWCKDVAPSPDLRRWWNHDAGRMPEFAVRYEAELDAAPDAVAHLLGIARAHDTVSLLFGAHDPVVNHAVVLREYLSRRMSEEA
jgi:uncharacterized protein YeaO (DUF488 family)